ncbi:Dickkopf N-terminal cysteine-rich domain-containing protein [Undibacterium luofuense]|uniref:Uncharacterized protein n=1 Tax=Undibacterium luofuense TaxID=2828733 RepID=A0A941I789_9BURK|nr:hypothetical protein [Undibacterium luofuense]
MPAIPANRNLCVPCINTEKYCNSQIMPCAGRFCANPVCSGLFSQ